EHLLEPPELPGCPRLFLDPQGRAELATGARDGVLAPHPVRFDLIGPHRGGEVDLLVELPVERRGAPEMSEAAPQRPESVPALVAHAVRMTRCMAATSFWNCL